MIEIRRVENRNTFIQPFKCRECNQSFAKENGLRHHIVMKHNANIIFSCIHCGEIYSQKDNLRNHQMSCLKLGEHLFECSVCDGKFTNYNDLHRHENISHAHHFAIDNFFECKACGKKFRRKDNLKVHTISCRNRVTEQDKFECAICDRVFTKRVSLKWHIQRNHLCEKVTKCDRCSAILMGTSKSTTVIQHKNDCRSHDSDAHINCALCGESFPSRKAIMHHIMGDQHKIVLSHEHLRFSTPEEFEDWKTSVEKATTTFFREKSCKHFKLHSVSRFVCHTSRSCEPNPVGRERRVKLQGPKKIGGFCPAEIILDRRKEDSLCRVSYVDTHLGHNVCNESELAHVYLGRKKRVPMVSKLLQGVPRDEISSNCAKLLHTKSFTDPLCLSTRKDLNNISKDCSVKNYNIPDSLGTNEKFDFKRSKSVMNIESFLSQHGKSVIHVKKPGSSCSFPFLKNEDVIVVIMTENQKQMLKKYAHKVVLAYGTFDMPKNSFLLQTLWVVDDYDEAIPVAFAISNCSNETTVDVFLNSLKQNCGSVEIEMLMHCAQLCYLRSWIKIMGPVRHHSFSKSFTNELWQLHLKKIIVPHKRHLMQNRLKEITAYLDLDMFHAELEELIADTDPDLRDFLLYFRKHFYENVESWAYCYRKVSKDSKNIYVESFSRALDCFCRKLKKIKSFSSGLAVISDYLITRENDLKRKKIHVAVPQKLMELRRRHDEFVKEDLLISIEEASNLGWYVSVSDENSEIENIHFIRECEELCGGCKLYCEKCDTCVHKFQCTCADNTIKNSMCNHIHALCAYLKEKKYHYGVGKTFHSASKLFQPQTDSLILETGNLTDSNDFFLNVKTPLKDCVRDYVADSVMAANERRTSSSFSRPLQDTTSNEMDVVVEEVEEVLLFNSKML